MLAGEFQSLAPAFAQQQKVRDAASECRAGSITSRDCPIFLRNGLVQIPGRSLYS